MAKKKTANTEPYEFYLDTRTFFKENGYKVYFHVTKVVWDNLIDHYDIKDKLVLVRYKAKHAVQMRYVELLENLLFWRLNIVFNVPIEFIDFYQWYPFNKKLYIDNFVRAISRFSSILGKITNELSECISYINDDFFKLSSHASYMECNTISLHGIIEFRNRDKEFRRITDTTLDESKGIKELEEVIAQETKNLVAVIKKDKVNELTPYINSQSFNLDQLSQMLVAVGPRPDIDKTILPKPIVRGYIHGLKDVSEYYIESITARNALLTKHNNVPLSGYLSRKMNLLCINTAIDYDCVDCGTSHHVDYLVKNEEYLAMIEGKYIKLPDGTLHEVTLNDNHLIGEQVKLRSHIVCGHKKEGHVCLTCYGAHAHRIRGTRIGGLPSMKISNPMLGKAMKAKHIQLTNSMEVSTEAMLAFFYIDGTNLYIRKEFAYSKKTFIVVDRDELEELLYSNIDTEDETIDTTVPLSSITIRHNDQDFVIESQGLMLTLSDVIVKDKKCFVDDKDDPDKLLVPIKKLDPELPIFQMIITTEEISKYLNKFLSLTDRTGIKPFQKDFNALLSEILETTTASGIFVMLNHFETILHNMIRDTVDQTKRPNFMQKDVDYTILRISSAIEKRDVVTRLLFQNIKRVFRNIDTYTTEGTSIFSYFFRVTPLDKAITSMVPLKPPEATT
jgi:hypothetical protein